VAKAESVLLDPDENHVPSVDDHERFLKKFSGRLVHPNHVLIVDVKYKLAKMYGRVEGYEPDALTDGQFRWVSAHGVLIVQE
jgi:hypothetical protein